MSYRTLKRVYLILAGGAFLMFLGHGAWAAFENSEKFRGLASSTSSAPRRASRIGPYRQPFARPAGRTSPSHW